MIARYYNWLHGHWPAGKVEKLPVADEHGQTNVHGLYVVGDLTGIPLLKFSADTGTRAVAHIAEDSGFAARKTADDVIDIAIIGLGVSGLAAAMEAKKRGLSYVVFEAAQPFSTIQNFPKGKPIFTYPTDMVPAGDVQFGEGTEVKEGLVDHLMQTLTAADLHIEPRRVNAMTSTGGRFVLEADGKTVEAHRVIAAIGRSGNFRKLGISGEDLDRVSNRLHDPQDFTGKKCLVVGGGDSAVETAIALARCGADVVLSYRKPELSRPKPENVDKLMALAKDPAADVDVTQPVSERVTTSAGAFMNVPRGQGSVRLMLGSDPVRIEAKSVTVRTADGEERTLDNDNVFVMIGREAPLDFFRRAGVHIQGEIRGLGWLTLALSVLLFTFVYHWKKTGVWLPIGEVFAERGWFPYNVPGWWASLGQAFNDPSTLVGTLKVSLGEPGFYYTTAYCAAIVVFGIRRVRRRKTPYVKWQTIALASVQIVPLFLLPYVLLPWLGHNGLFDDGVMKSIGDELFPLANYGQGREYWRAFGLILAWPLFVWNVFTDAPMWGWLAISVVQTFVIIPALLYRFGKGAYCGWICSCGALAETMGDAHRHKMPHGPGVNKLNMIGQAFLLFAFVLLVFRVLGWAFPDGPFAHWHHLLFKDLPVLNYNWFVDLLFAGIIGVALYWHFSGRVWCRFACPLAALMHIYTRFSQFAIISEKKKCISCNVCTSVCHQGIDIMNFANKGLPMQDPECVRCSACVQSCPTGVLSFGRVNQAGETLGKDRLAASPVQMTELVQLRSSSTDKAA